MDEYNPDQDFFCGQSAKNNTVCYVFLTLFVIELAALIVCLVQIQKHHS
jgi:hypothetical protein